ncbi:UNVERIFIED_CONTAM: hypothetical protein Sradi_3020900 [Sesamum radiatum]|uniref:RNase H type-1 domain-containing protein n=1 Tax=Sesamum radiatum TaxID=300843 RepID=A0AAW2S3G2_SESRA
MKLNPTKWTFAVRGGKFLGNMVSKRGIEANPEKIEAIMQLQSPKTLKDAQKLIDASSNASNGGACVLLQGPDRVEIEVEARLSFFATTNEAQYEALILGLVLAYEAGARELDVCTDFQLVTMQMCDSTNPKKWERKGGSLIQIWGNGFRGKKQKCDNNDERKSSGDRDVEVQAVKDMRSWKDDLIDYLKSGTLPAT